MQTFTQLTALLILTASSLSSSFADVTFQSTDARTHLLELYTSEGCSSCPPAEKWLSQIRQSPRLWKEIVPVAFHVDYWDQLGWPDRFASKANTARQRSYAASWGTETVYTPGFVLDGVEWRGHSLDGIGAPVSAARTGVLKVSVDKSGKVTVVFHPAKTGRNWEAHIALLGFDLTTRVKAGENSGRALLHDFVALSHEQKPMTANGDSAQAETKLPTQTITSKTALAVWVTEADKLEPAQAVGGLL